MVPPCFRIVQYSRKVPNTDWWLAKSGLFPPRPMFREIKAEDLSALGNLGQKPDGYVLFVGVGSMNSYDGPV